MRILPPAHAVGGFFVRFRYNTPRFALWGTTVGIRYGYEL